MARFKSSDTDISLEYSGDVIDKTPFCWPEGKLRIQAITSNEDRRSYVDFQVATLPVWN